LGDTGLLGWTLVSHHVGSGADDAPECRIHPFYNAGEQASGLTSYYPGGTGGCHDGGHDLLVTRSAELWGPVSFTYNAMGGAGSSATAGPDEGNVAAGFMGAALRRVSDGTYVASVRHPCTGGCAGQIEQVVLGETGNAGEKYTIDLIDNYAGGWGWMLCNDMDIHQGLPDYVTVQSSSVTGRPDSSEETVCDGSNCANGGAIYLTSSDLEFMRDNTVEQIIAVRFPSVPLDSTPVDRAWVLFDVDEADAWEAGQAVVIGIYGELAPNSAALGSANNDVSSRAVTSAMSAWSPGGTGVVHEELVTSDVAAIVNEITAQAGWASGNPITLIFTQIRGLGSRWVEASRNNNGIDTPALFYGSDPCAASNPDPPCVDDYFGLVNLFTGLGCGSLPGLYGESVADTCARTINIHEGWDTLTGASASAVGGNQGSATGAQLCPVMCDVCDAAQQGFATNVGHAHFTEW